jgi:hypothetical protein
MTGARPLPVVPGVRSWARRPSVLCLAPAWTLTVLFVVGVAAAVTVPFWPSEGSSDQLVRIDDDCLVGVFGALVVLAFSWELQQRKSAYERLAGLIGDLVMAWEGMKRASGINWAVEANLMEAQTDTHRRTLGKRRCKRIDRIYATLREVPAIPRPISLTEMQSKHRDRYHEVLNLNKDIAGVFHSGMDRRHRKPIDLPLVDDTALERLNAAAGNWEKALAAARSHVARWQVLDDLLVRCDTLVRHWWTYVQNDPYYRNPQPEKGQRSRAFDQAKDAVDALRESVGKRSIGHPT